MMKANSLLLVCFTVLALAVCTAVKSKIPFKKEKTILPNEFIVYIYRDSYMGAFNNIYPYYDGKPIAYLGVGGYISMHLPAGEHTIEFKDWAKWDFGKIQVNGRPGQAFVYQVNISGLKVTINQHDYASAEPNLKEMKRQNIYFHPSLALKAAKARGQKIKLSPGGRKTARVFFAGFINRTGSEDYSYLVGSIPGGIASSMTEVFQFDYMPEKENLQVDETNAGKQAASLGADYIVFGEFNTGGSGLLILAKVYDHSSKQTNIKLAVTGPSDGRIFTSIHNLADGIVQSIHQVSSAPK